MTDENLVAELRHPIQRNERYYEPLCDRAADELERLAALVQSDTEPVAWRYRIKGSSSWFVALNDDAAYWRASNYEVEPLYTARVIDNGEIR